MCTAGKMIAGKPIYVALAQLKVERQAQLVLFSWFLWFCFCRLLLTHLLKHVLVLLYHLARLIRVTLLVMETEIYST